MLSRIELQGNTQSRGIKHIFIKRCCAYFVTCGRFASIPKRHPPNIKGFSQTTIDFRIRNPIRWANYVLFVTLQLTANVRRSLVVDVGLWRCHGLRKMDCISDWSRPRLYWISYCHNGRVCHWSIRVFLIYSIFLFLGIPITSRHSLIM